MFIKKQKPAVKGQMLLGTQPLEVLSNFVQKAGGGLESFPDW